MKELDTGIRRGRTIASPDTTAQVWFHTALLATALIATIAVGIASAAITSRTTPASKSDRLPIAEQTLGDYSIVETRGDGVSVLERVPLTATD